MKGFVNLYDIRKIVTCSPGKGGIGTVGSCKSFEIKHNDINRKSHRITPKSIVKGLPVKGIF